MSAPEVTHRYRKTGSGLDSGQKDWVEISFTNIYSELLLLRVDKNIDEKIMLLEYVEGERWKYYRRENKKKA